MAALFLLLCPAAADTERLAPEVVIAKRPVKIAQLVGETDHERKVPTANRTWSRYKLAGTDLGVSFRHKRRTYLLFGDTIGPPGGDAFAWTTDDNPEDGLELTFLDDGNGTYRPLTIPGISQRDFEVPMEGTSVGGRMYVYHTTNHSETVTMGRSVVAVSEDDGKSFRYLYDLSHQHFINVSVVEVKAQDWKGVPQRRGDGLFLFGSGPYRESEVRLAYQPARQIETASSLRYFTGLDRAGRPVWSGDEAEARPLFALPDVKAGGIGELSVSYNRFLRKWLLLYNSGQPRGILLRTADRPWGPWSEAQVLFEPWQDGGYGHFLHVNWEFRKLDEAHDPGRENEWGGEYGPYQLEHLARGRQGETTIYFTLSTWNPYTVVLMKATLRRQAAPSR